MLKFSVSRVRKGSKVAYKNYREVLVDSMDRVAELAREHSFSSYIYTAGRTDPSDANPEGEVCEGHRAERSVLYAGSVLLFDFDDRGATFEAICDRLHGVSAWVGPSKSWSKTVGKFHVLIELDRELPLNKGDFERIYLAATQWFNFDGLNDPCMKSWTQQMAPHWHEAGSDYPERVIEGVPLNVDEILAAYVPGESFSKGGTGLSGAVRSDAVFTIVKDKRKMAVGAMIDEAMVRGKIRCECLDGYEHDGRRDTAFVRHVDGYTFYRCSGGRCGFTLMLQDPKPFDALPDEGGSERVVGVGVGSGAVGVGLGAALDYISQSSAHAGAFASRANDGKKEMAVGYGGKSVLDAADVRRFDGYIRVWDGKMWKVLFEDEDAVYRFSQELYKAVGFDALAYSNSRVSATTKLLVRSCRVPVVLGGGGDLINLNNGMVRIEASGVQLLAHDKEALFTTCLPFNFDPAASCPTWDLIVKRVMMMDSDLIVSLQDALGYLFLRTTNYEKMIGFVGEGENGKSTVQTVLKMLLGAQGYSAQPLHKLTQPGSIGEYARASLEGRWVNFTNELSPKDLASEEFKNLISGEDIAAREPYGKPFVIRNAPKQLAAMNTTDKLIKENTHGFQRRLHMIPFNYRIQSTDKDPQLWQKLGAELPGIFNWVMAGAVRVLNNRKLTEAQVILDLKADVLRDANSVQQFLEEQCHTYVPHWSTLDSAEKQRQVIGVNELYLGYKEFTAANGYYPFGRNRFSKEVEKLGVIKVRENLRVHGTVVMLSGFRLGMSSSAMWPVDEDETAGVTKSLDYKPFKVEV